jgi:hypothetical protein
VSEKAMRNTFRQRMLEHDSSIHWQRIEDACQAGIPDINFCWQGIEFWVEAKQAEESDIPKRNTTLFKLGLQPEQALWLENRRCAGGRAYVLAKVGNRWLLFNSHFRQLRDGMMWSTMLTTSINWTGKFVPEHILGMS